MSQSEFRDYYEILEIPFDAPHHEVVQAYHRAKQAYDTNSPALYSMFTKEEAMELRALIEEAYQVLGNQARRKEYDSEFRGSTQEDEDPQLPDFPPPENLEVLKERKNPSDLDEVGKSQAKGSTQTPEGFRRNRFGVYQLDPGLEEEIQNRTEFDGAFLRKIRTYQNINLEQLSKETRISRTYLAAIETDDYESLPAAVFVRGFIVQVARVLGLEEAKAASSYMSRFQKPE